MPLYFSSHTTACLTKQDLRELIKGLLRFDVAHRRELAERQGVEVKIRRAVASQLGGRMVVETDAPDQKSLEKFFQARRINIEWLMRIDLDGRNGGVVEY